MRLCIGKYPYSDLPEAEPDPVDVNKIAYDNNAEGRNQRCSVVDQMLSDVINSSELELELILHVFLVRLPLQ